MILIFVREPNPRKRTPRDLKGFQQREVWGWGWETGSGGEQEPQDKKPAPEFHFLPGLFSHSFPFFIQISLSTYQLPDPVPVLPPYPPGSPLYPWFRDEIPGRRSECGKGSREGRQSSYTGEAGGVWGRGGSVQRQQDPSHQLSLQLGQRPWEGRLVRARQGI